MTSVSGHLITKIFEENSKNWNHVSPIDLFESKLVTILPDENRPIVKNLERNAMKCDKLILWTDCDREGEHIAFQIIDVCKRVKPEIQIYRAIFSEINEVSVKRAIQNLGQPNKLLSDAVDVRQELDLRIGRFFNYQI